MSSGQRCLASGAGALLVVLSTAAAPQTRWISGVVETSDGKGLPRVTVRVTNAGGTVATDSGEFTIGLKPGIEPGDPVELSVPGWVITSPLGGTHPRA